MNVDDPRLIWSILKKKKIPKKKGNYYYSI